MKLHLFTTAIIGIILILVFSLQQPINAAEMSLEVPLELEKPSYVAPWKRYSHNRWNQTDWKEFSNLRYERSVSIAKPHKFVTPINGNPETGKKLVNDRKRGGSCLACHIFPNVSLPGNVGPNLSLIGLKKRSDEDLFNYIYDPRQFNPNTIMPPWGKHKFFTKDEIKDIVSYLKTLTKPSEFKTPEDNPANRPIPVETRDNLDPFENPGIFTLELGEELFTTSGPTGKSCLDCHTDENIFSTWAVTMPKFETRLNKIIGIEEFVTRHVRATTGANYLAQSEQNLGLAIYLRYLANGQIIAIDSSDEKTQAAIKRGKSLIKQKIGQLNFACTDCHAMKAYKWIRGQYLVKPLGMYGHFPTYRTSRGEIWDIRKRLQWCNVSARANELPPDASEYGDIEIYLATSNNGSILSVPGIRH
jgi:sulfur-oxidizing protein SoxA